MKTAEFLSRGGDGRGLPADCERTLCRPSGRLCRTLPGKEHPRSACIIPEFRGLLLWEEKPRFFRADARMADEGFTPTEGKRRST